MFGVLRCVTRVLGKTKRVGFRTDIDGVLDWIFYGLYIHTWTICEYASGTRQHISYRSVIHFGSSTIGAIAVVK